MNIHDFWDQLPEVPDLGYKAIEDLFSRRLSTAIGFAAVEQNNGGFVSVPAELNTKKGQDIARLLFFRGLEEVVESIAAYRPEHVLEELIDATNYLMEALLLDERLYLRHPIATTLSGRLTQVFRVAPTKEKPNLEDLGWWTKFLGDITENFRNRAWMNNAQDVYFNGERLYLDNIVHCLVGIAAHFPSWDEYWKFFVAKDEVLKFRLRSNY